ncbi:conserved hypothetical protein [delta proteobacterium NaphS2]|nr:conserved hypothetical protein [delta proteobacterium NaphS2]
MKRGVAIEEQIESARKSKPTKSQGAVKPNRVGKFLPPLIPLILVLLAVLIFLILRGEAKADQLNIIFLDLSGSQKVTGYSGKKTEFQKNVRSIEDFIRNNLVPGDELKVVGITESTFSRPNVLLDGTVSREKGAFGENLAREKLRLLNKWKNLDLKPTAKKTDILGAANLAAILFSDRPGKKHLIFFSDMRQCTREMDIETPNQIDCKKALATVTQKGLVPDMQGIQVICLGVHSAKKTPVYWRNLKQFWAAFFHQANAKLVTFTMERRFVHE